MNAWSARPEILPSLLCLSVTDEDLGHARSVSMPAVKRIQSSQELAEHKDFETVSDDQMDKVSRQWVACIQGSNGPQALRGWACIIRTCCWIKLVEALSRASA